MLPSLNPHRTSMYPPTQQIFVCPQPIQLGIQTSYVQMNLPVQFYQYKEDYIQDMRPPIPETQTVVRPQIQTELLALREIINLYEKNLQQLKD